VLSQLSAVRERWASIFAENSRIWHGSGLCIAVEFSATVQFADESCDERRPAGLVTGPQSATGFAIEVFMEQIQFVPAGVIAVAFVTAVAWAMSVRSGHEQADLAPHQFFCDFSEGHQDTGTGGAFDFEVCSVELVIAFQGLNQQVIEWKPDGSAPVAVPAEHR